MPNDKCPQCLNRDHFLLTGIVGCCARKVSGPAVADPTIALTKSRRRIAFPKAEDCARIAHREYDYSKDLRPAKLGSRVSLRGSNPEPLMSALGH